MSHFFWLHYDLGARMLADPASAADLWPVVQTFIGISPAFAASFSLFFGFGRCLIAAAALTHGAFPIRLAGGLLAVTGLQNLAAPLSGPLGWDEFASVSGALYPPIWLAGLLAIAGSLFAYKTVASGR